VTRFDSAGGFQGYKRSLHEGGIRIPFIAWWPGTITPGVTDHMGYFPDLLPTCCALAAVLLLGSRQTTMMRSFKASQNWTILKEPISGRSS